MHFGILILVDQNFYFLIVATALSVECLVLQRYFELASGNVSLLNAMRTQTQSVLVALHRNDDRIELIRRHHLRFDQIIFEFERNLVAEAMHQKRNLGKEREYRSGFFARTQLVEKLVEADSARKLLHNRIQRRVIVDGAQR